MSGRTILLADDDASLRMVLSQALSRLGHQVRATASLPALVKWVRDGDGDLVVSDVYLGDDSLFDSLPSFKTLRPDLPVIVMSGQSTVLTALSAMGGGAFEYLPKPFDLDALTEAVARALNRTPDARSRASAASAEREERLPLIGRSQAMQEVYRVLARVSATDLAVLIEGESGSGKERVARALHEFSRRKNGPFVPFSLAGPPDSLEAELLGRDGKPGRLGQAHGGVLFLDDLDDLNLQGQARLLRILQELEPSDAPNVRLVATAKANLADLARDGRFRQDLLYRLNVVTLRLPALRDRLDDVGDLARAFLVRARREGLPEKTLEATAVEALKRHHWPGNVRELENLLRRAAVLRPEPLITAREIEQELAPHVSVRARPEPAGQNSFDAALKERVRLVMTDAREGANLYDAFVSELERPLLEGALEATRGNQIKAAAILGINRNTLRKKIVALGIRAGRSD